MDCMKASSSVRQPDKVIGPTVVLLYLNEEIITEPGEDGEACTVYKYDFYRFSNAEYDNLKNNGILPDGATWDAELRTIERSGMHDRADIEIARANDYIATETAQESVDAWTAYRDAVRVWKMAVRNTIKQKKFPKTVKYPVMPDRPA